MHGFGQVDDVDERWKMGFEKVVRQTVLRLVLTIVYSWYLLHLQSDPTSEDRVHDKIECFGAVIITDDEIKETNSAHHLHFLLKLVNILLPLNGTSNRPYRAVRGPLSYT